MKRSLYNDDHEAFRDTLQDLHRAGAAAQPPNGTPREHHIDREVWLEAGRQGFLGLEIAEEYGGAGAEDYRFNAVLGEELSKFGAAYASCFGIHADVVAPYLVDLGTEEQKKTWLPRMCTGEVVDRDRA